MAQGKIVTIRENQLRRIFENVSRLDESLSERIFHFTTLKSGYNILKTNEMFCQSAFAGYGNENFSRNKKFYISFSRNKSPYEGFGSNEKSVRFEFDGKLLNQNFEGHPVNYFMDKGLNNKYRYQRLASGLSDWYNYEPLSSLPNGVEATKVKRVPHATASSPQYIDLNGSYAKKVHHKNDIDKAIGYKYYPTNGFINGAQEVSKSDFEFPSENSPKYISYNGKTYKLERAIPSSIATHVDNEFEDRLFTTKASIHNIRDYIKRVDVLIENFETLDEESKRYAYGLALMGSCFIYGNANDFLAQNDNVINKEILDINDAYTKYGKVFASKQSYVIDLFAYFFKALTIPMNNDQERFRFISSTLQKYSFGHLTKNVIKKMNSLWSNYTDCLSITSDEVANLSHNPSKDGQTALQLITDVMQEKGYNSWRDAAIKIQAEIDEKYGHGNGARNNVDYNVSKKLRILVSNGHKFDITDDSKTDFWYIFEMKSLQSRYSFINDLMYNLENEYYNPRWFEVIRDHNIDKFKRYLQHLAHKKVTFGKMKAIFDKLGVNIEDISMLGYPDIKEIVVDYWEFTSRGILPPYKLQGQKENESLWDICDKYANELYKKSEA